MNICNINPNKWQQIPLLRYLISGFKATVFLLILCLSPIMMMIFAVIISQWVTLKLFNHIPIIFGILGILLVVLNIGKLADSMKNKSDYSSGYLTPFSCATIIFLCSIASARWGIHREIIALSFMTSLISGMGFIWFTHVLLLDYLLEKTKQTYHLSKEIIEQLVVVPFIFQLTLFCCALFTYDKWAVMIPQFLHLK